MLSSINKFREWASKFSIPSQIGEWECDYPRWGDIYSQVIEFLNLTSYLLWTDREIADLLYIIGRDNETQHLAELLGEKTERLIWILQKCLDSHESDAKWQLIVEAGKLKEWDQSLEALIYRLYFDKDYYVQRRALLELARKKSKLTLELAGYSWKTGEQYQRMCVLVALHDINYNGISEFLSSALKSEQEYLVQTAERISKERLKELSE